MKTKRLYTKEMLLKAMRHTKSVRAAARYLGCSYQTIVPYFKMFKDDATGKTLFEIHTNPSGKGVPKFIKGRSKEFGILEILEGRVDPCNFSPERIKRALINESYLAEECYKCGFNERRILDYKVPLLLNFKDKNRKHYNLDNLELLCYNCFYLYVGDVFEPTAEETLYDSNLNRKNKPTLELDKHDLENMKALGLI